MLATSKNVLFPGHNHLLTTGADDPTLWLLPEHHHFIDSTSRSRRSGIRNVSHLLVCVLASVTVCAFCSDHFVVAHGSVVTSSRQITEVKQLK